METERSQSGRTEATTRHPVSRVLARATEVLGSRDLARAWLRRPVRSIGAIPPQSLLATDAGYILVLDTLGRIEQEIRRDPAMACWPRRMSCGFRQQLTVG